MNRLVLSRITIDLHLDYCQNAITKYQLNMEIRDPSDLSCGVILQARENPSHAKSDKLDKEKKIGLDYSMFSSQLTKL